MRATTPLSAVPPVAAPEAPAELAGLFQRLAANAPSLRRTSASQRAGKLRRLKEELLARRPELHRALWQDFRKPSQEVDLTEILQVTSEINHALRHLGGWMRPQRVPTPVALIGNSSAVRYEPKGVVLIISPWNYPVNLSLGPVVSAVAAGNAVVLKPSEFTPHTNAVLRTLLERVFSPDELVLQEGDGPATQALLKLPFDHVFFTGSPQVGRLVMRAAAEHLSSVTLELGGKSPAIVDATADLDLAAERLAFGKFSNAGQTCIAPDYVLVDAKVHDALVARLQRRLERLYGSSEQARQQSPDLPHLIHARHQARIQRLVDQALQAGARRVMGELPAAAADNYFPPTLLTDVPLDSDIMQEEIFGPVLPILRFHRLEEALALVRGKPKPLALYVFSGDPAAHRRMLEETSAGGGCINDTLLHYSSPHLPFGGVGTSGMGRAHGRAGFCTFSNPRAVVERRFGAWIMRLFDPPYRSGWAARLIPWLLRYF